jgi:hypothetical protein
LEAFVNRNTDPFEVARLASLRAYERGRLQSGIVRAVTLCLVSAGLSLALVGARGLAWLPLTLVTWGFVEWRGVGFVRGGRVGVLAGVVTLALPMSALRWCCRPGALEMMGADCCSMPGACAAAGGVVGLTMACFLPVPEKGKRVETLLGMLLGIVAVAPMKCTSLLLGEALGLVGGLVAGAFAAMAVRALARKPVPA